MDVEKNLPPQFLRTFRKAYELRNFTETAKELGLTQSGVSQHVAHLEEILRTPLFERVGRGLSPTRTGDRLYAFGGQWLGQMEELVNDVRLGEQKIAGNVCVGAPGSFGVFVLKALTEWQIKNPGIVLDIEYGPSSVMEQAMRSGRMDLAITSEALDTRFFLNEEFFQEEYVLVSHPDLKPKLDSWEEFCLNPFVDYVGSPGIFQKWIATQFKRQATSGQRLNVRARINNMESIFYLLQQKVGITIFPSEPILDLVQKKKLKIHRTTRQVFSPLYLVRRHGQIFSRRIQAVNDLILELVREHRKNP